MNRLLGGPLPVVARLSSRGYLASRGKLVPSCPLATQNCGLKWPDPRGPERSCHPVEIIHLDSARGTGPERVSKKIGTTVMTDLPARTTIQASMTNSAFISDWLPAPTLRPACAEFIIGDVHGMSTGLDVVIKVMSDSSGAGDGHLTLLGDLIDKGPDPVGAMRLASRPAAELGFGGKTLVVGNHDLFLLLMLDWYRQRLEPADEWTPSTRHSERDCLNLWVGRNGGHTIFDQLGVDEFSDIGRLRRRLIDRLGDDGLVSRRSDYDGLIQSKNG